MTSSDRARSRTLPAAVRILVLLVPCVATLLPAPAARCENPPVRLIPILKDGRWGLADADGKVVTSPRFAHIGTFSDGLAPVLSAGGWGYVDSRGEVVVEPRYGEILAFTDGLGAVRSGSTWGYVDRTGRPAGTRRFEKAGPFSGGLAAVRIDGRWGFVDRGLEPVIAPRFDRAWGFTEGLAPVCVEGRWGYVDRDGRMAVEPRFHWVDQFSEGLAYVEGGGRDAGYLDRTGRLVIRRRFWGANPFTDGLAGVQPEVCGNWGLIDRTGRMRVSPRFDRIGRFSEGLAPVRIYDDSRYLDAHKWGYADRTGKLVIPAGLSFAEPFSGGIARAGAGREIGYIDRTGASVSGPYARGAAGGPPPVSPAPAGLSGPRALDARIVGPDSVPPESVSLVGNPYRKRFPDGTPQVFSRNIRDMILYRGRIYLGCGDYLNNTGPVDITSFAPGRRGFEHEYTAPDEMVSSFYVFEDRLCIPGNDPRESWAFGNIYVKEAGRWRKHRTIRDGIHCFVLAHVAGHWYAIVSTTHGRKLVASKDRGKSWSPVPAYDIPTVIFPFRGTLCGLDRRGTFYDLEDGVLRGRPMVPRRRRLAGIEPAPSGSNLACGRVHRFGNGVIILPPVPNVDAGGAGRQILRLEEPDETPRPIRLFFGGSVMDAVIRGPTLHLLCTGPGETRYRNTIFSTEDLTTWRRTVTFTTEAFARSLEEAGGSFYVSLGCDGPAREGLPKATGDVLRVTPAPRAR